MKGDRAVLSVCAAAAVLAGWSAAIRCQDPRGEIVDRVVAVVEDRTILQSELDMHFQQRMMQQNKETFTAEEEKQGRREAMDWLVANMLLAIHAEKMGIEAPEAEVDAQVDRSIESNVEALGGTEAFNRELEKAGLTLEQLKEMRREQIKANFLVDGLYRTEIRDDVQVTDGEIREYFKAHQGEIQKRPATVTLAQILVMMKASESADRAARDRIDSIEKMIMDGADFAETAEKMSDGPSAQYGGNLGYIKLSDMDSPMFEEAVRKLLVGQVSPPVLTEHGYHLIKLEEVRGDEVKLRHILVQRQIDEAATEALTEDIRRRIIEGADFGEMARQYSEDRDSRENGGVVGEVEVPRLPDFFTAAIKDVGDGGIAPLIREPKGFRIIKVLGRTPERPYTLEEAKDGLKELMEREKLQERLDEYVEGLKKIYHVDVKIAI